MLASAFPCFMDSSRTTCILQLALRRLSGRASSSTRPLAGTSRSRLAGPASARPAAPPSPLSLLPLATSSRPPWCVPYHSSTAAHQLTHACPARSRSTASPRQRTTRSRATTPRTRRSASSPWAARLPPSAAARPSATRRTRPPRSRRCRRRRGAGACTASARAGRARVTGWTRRALGARGGSSTLRTAAAGTSGRREARRGRRCVRSLVEAAAGRLVWLVFAGCPNVAPSPRAR